MTDPMISALGYMLDKVGAENGQLVLAKQDDKWVVGCFFGVEALDSPIAGGAAHGLGPDLTTALTQAAGEMGWTVDEPRPTPTTGSRPGAPRMLTAYDEQGHEIARWQARVDVTSLDDLPPEAFDKVASAALVVGSVGDVHTVLKSRYTSLSMPADEALAALRARAVLTETVPDAGT